MSDKPAAYLYPAVLAALKVAYPRENADALAAAASWIWQSRNARKDDWGRIEFHPEAARIAPLLLPFPGYDPPPGVSKIAHAATVERWITHKNAGAGVGRPVDMLAPEAPAETEGVRAAEALESKAETYLARVAYLTESQRDGETGRVVRGMPTHLAQDLAAGKIDADAASKEWTRLRGGDAEMTAWRRARGEVQ